jgi:hypothetical protein
MCSPGGSGVEKSGEGNGMEKSGEGNGVEKSGEGNGVGRSGEEEEDREGGGGVELCQAGWE